MPENGRAMPEPEPLALDEYDRATREFFSEAVHAVARASNPILGQIQREKVEVIAKSLNSAPTSIALASESSMLPFSHF